LGRHDHCANVCQLHADQCHDLRPGLRFGKPEQRGHSAAAAAYLPCFDTFGCHADGACGQP
ncbi:hypothetical protein O6474_23515, partial [Salmonella enterica subsp. enterica]